MSRMVSIIVPVYNCENYIEEAAQSVLDQTCPDWELILVNDGSTDSSGELVKKIASKDSRILCFDRENQGVSAARNFGLTHATGQYVMFLDADDKLFPDAVKTMVEKADGVDLVICGIQKSGGTALSVTEKERCYNSITDSAEDVDNLYRKAFYHSPCNKLYQRERITNLFDQNFSHGEDLLFNLGYFENCGKIRVIPQLLYWYRESIDGSLTRRFFKETDEYLQILLDRFIHVVGDVPKVRNAVSYDVIQILLVQTKHLMNSDRSSGEKRAIIQAWSKNPVIRDKRINKKAAKNTRHRIIFTLYQLRMITLIMMICK